MPLGERGLLLCVRVAMGDDQKLTGPGTSKNRKKKHISTYSYCCRTQHTTPGVSYEGQHRVERAVGVARGEASFSVSLGRSYQKTRQSSVWAWVLFFKNIIIYEYILRARYEWRATKTHPEKELDTENLPVIAKTRENVLQIAHF